jgi:signal transduction histidine kinase/ActR/RegA family two-component response regulator
MLLLLLFLITATALSPWYSAFSLVVFSITIQYYTYAGIGPFAQYELPMGALICWFYISSVATTAFILSSILHQRKDDHVRLSELVKELHLSLEKSQSGNQTQNVNLTSIGHDIRTPLSGILGMSELLQDTNLSSEQQEEVEAIRSSAECLKTILDDILEFSRIEMTGVEIAPAPCDLHQLFTTITRLFGALARPKGLEIKLDVDNLFCPAVIVDAARLRQVVTNLLNNAVKFTHTGSVELRVSSRLLDDDPTTVRLQCIVIDTGVGIAKEIQSKVFDPFVKISTDSGTSDGVGLGLAICRDLIDVMGGSLHLESSPQGGTRVSFVLTVPKAEQMVNESSYSDLHDSPAPSPKVLRVLVAEDNEVNLKLLTRLLLKMGCKITVAVNGEQAVEAFGKNEYDLVFMDIFMPVMDGLDATRAIRASGERGAKVPIVAVSATVGEDAQLRCRAAGINMFIGKPYTAHDILNAIQRYGKHPSTTPITSELQRS